MSDRAVAVVFVAPPPDSSPASLARRVSPPPSRDRTLLAFTVHCLRFACTALLATNIDAKAVLLPLIVAQQSAGTRLFLCLARTFWLVFRLLLQNTLVVLATVAELWNLDINFFPHWMLRGVLIVYFNFCEIIIPLRTCLENAWLSGFTLVVFEYDKNSKAFSNQTPGLLWSLASNCARI